MDCMMCWLGGLVSNRVETEEIVVTERENIIAPPWGRGVGEGDGDRRNLLRTP